MLLPKHVLMSFLACHVVVRAANGICVYPFSHGICVIEIM